MEYIVIINPDQKNHAVIESNHFFLERFSSYEAAKTEAELWKSAGDCKSYSIYGLCSDERNHII